MDVLNKLRNSVSNTISNTVTNTAYGLSQLSSVLPGNPVTREYEVNVHIASAGPSLLWKIYSGHKKSTKQEAAIFVFEKKILDRWSNKQAKETILETLKRGVTQLTKLRHPHILTVQHPLEESRDSLAFATEPIFASLANVLGNLEHIPHPHSKSIGDYSLLDVEIRYGLLQLGEGLVFLHNDVKLLHRNICPESIVINKHGAWKIFGFDFCALNLNPNEKQPSWSNIEYDPNILPVGQSHLEYQAPECILSGFCGPFSDIFALGMLTYVIYAPNNQPFHECHDDKSKCQFFAEFEMLPDSKLVCIPDGLRETIKLMLCSNPDLRPDAHQFIKIDYFMDIGVETLNYLDKLFQWDNLQKSQFYKGLPYILKQLPHRVVLYRILPCLYKEFVNAPMIPFVLPSILQVLEVCTIDEFNECILPSLKPVLAMAEPPQISFVLLQRINSFLKLCSADLIKTDIIPMLTRALDSYMEQHQELCLAALPTIAKLIDSPTMKNTILPRIKKICLRKTLNDGSFNIRVNCLLCLSRILEHLDRWLVLDQILPFLREIPYTGEPAVLMALIGLYKLILTHRKLGISKEVLATQVLPFLLPMCVEQNLSSSQYDALASLVSDMVQRVTSEHRESLRQLYSVHREVLDENLLRTTNPTIANTHGGFSFNSAVLPVFSEQSIKTGNNEGLSLDDKYEFAQRLSTSKTEMHLEKLEPTNVTGKLLINNSDELNNIGTEVISANYNGPNSFISSYTNMNNVSSMLEKSSAPMHWNKAEMVPSINKESQILSPITGIQNWSNDQLKYHPTFNRQNNDRAFNSRKINSVPLSINPVSSMNTQRQNKLVNLSHQDIIDFLS